jgi:hypothetical protein
MPTTIKIFTRKSLIYREQDQFYHSTIHKVEHPKD